MEHQPARPSWDCKACDKPWPCDPAREELVAETGGGTVLIMAGWDWFEQAMLDMPVASGAELYDRFVVWTRIRPAGRRPR